MSTKVIFKVCLICGDKANGFHFDAITCESCKSFFRRTALKVKTLRCYLGSKCTIDVMNRTFCKKCRLDKCFEVGMKVKYIHSREQKKSNKQIDETVNNDINNSVNVFINSIVDFNTDSSQKCLNSSTDLPVIYKSESNVLSDLLENSEYKNNKIYKINKIGINSSIDVWHSDNTLNTNNKSKKSLITSTDMTLMSLPVMITDYSSVFNEVEDNRLQELQNAIQCLRYPNIERQNLMNKISDANHKFELNCENEIKKLIQMSKCLNTFVTMCANDQFILIKYATLEIAIMRTIAYYDFHSQYCRIISEDNVSNMIYLDIFNGHKRNTYNYRKNIFENMCREWDSDHIIIDLLTAIILFNSDRPNLLHGDIVKFQQHIYMYLLQRYLLLKYQSDISSKNKFHRLLSTLKDLNALNDKIVINCMEDYNRLSIMNQI